MTKLAPWLLHAYLIVFPVAFMAIFVFYGVMMTHAEPGAWLLDIVLPAAIALLLTWAMLKLARRVTRHLAEGRRWARNVVIVEIVAALAIAGYLFSLATAEAAAVGGLGLLVALGGVWAIWKRKQA